MKKQKVMSQMKGEGKIPEKQLNEMETGNLPGEKKKNDSEDKPGSQEKNGGKD